MERNLGGRIGWAGRQMESGCGGRGRRALTSLTLYGVKASGIVCFLRASPPTPRKVWALIPLPAVGEGKSLKSPRE